jgi:hypothetical protein
VSLTVPLAYSLKSHVSHGGRRDSNPHRASFFIQLTAALLASLAVPVIEHLLGVILERPAVPPLHHDPEYGRGIRFNRCRSRIVCSPASSPKRSRTFVSALSERRPEPLDDRAEIRLET